ncbi:hypothetical protein [Paenibacillus sp. sgz302251]|uniref:hypothetical protein n=1 Tax=Paenibacillus sp. sgz302251 TaxID=3414493 RepID=UPI003C7D1A78
MQSINNAAFNLQLSDRGFVDKLLINDDRDSMNWVIDPAYMNQVEYSDEDKLFGHFGVKIDGKDYDSLSVSPMHHRSASKSMELSLVYHFDRFDVQMTYDLESDSRSMRWHISLRNRSSEALEVESFHVWAALAYIMYRDPDVNRNISQSCAVFPSVSNDFTKLACVRRSGKGPHLGIYSVQGAVRSIGTFCRFENNFFKNVSPSLDGILFHNLILAGTGTEDARATASDWIYAEASDPLRIKVGEEAVWEFCLMPYADERQFYENGLALGHPIVEYSPVTIVGGSFHASFRLAGTQKLRSAFVESSVDGNSRRMDVTDRLKASNEEFELQITLERPGEHKLLLELDNGKKDFTVFNVLAPTKEIIEARADYITRHLYQDNSAAVPHAFLPVSNQGESLGKLNLVLMKNLMGTYEPEQVRKVENSAVLYMKTKWFENGDFYRPVKLYGDGDFYRIIDFDYVAHVYFLLSKFQAQQLLHAAPQDYLRWAAEVMIVRLDEKLHEEEREKKETQMLGVYILFIKDLLKELEQQGLKEEHALLSRLWMDAGERIRKETAHYKGAVTEHFYDNAGFGPTAEALCLLGYTEEAGRYGELLLANIGFSNDFRAQNPDRWWESLSYMIHSLWGGMVAASALVAYEHLRNKEYLKAAYRAAMPVFYCYDWNATATNKKLERGQAASTYSVAGPNLNRPDLSRNRFGQSVFAQDGGLFAELFSNASGDDWDMGEELAAYLAGFGMKTFLYEEEGKLRCINGEITKVGEAYVVTSYAAYPREFHFFEKDASFIASPGEDARTVIYENGQFRLEGRLAAYGTSSTK